MLYRSEISSPQLLRIHLKFRTLPSYDTKMYMWFKNFAVTIFCWSYCLCRLRFCSYHSLNVHDGTDLILCRMFCNDLKMAHVI